MLLAVDIGNTHIVVGVFKKKELLCSWRLSSGTAKTEDECWALLHALAKAEELDLAEANGCILSSVVPDLTPILEAMVRSRLGLRPILVNSTLDLGIKIHYEDPSTVGADRLCNAIAGYDKYGGPLIVVDFGTATTFDVVSESGDYIGGIISPGIETSLQTLHRRAARLMKVELRFPERLVGWNTESSMQAGLMCGTAELVDGLVRGIIQEIGGKPKVIATGGLASVLVAKLQTVSHVEPDLTLYGLRIIYDRVDPFQSQP